MWRPHLNSLKDTFIKTTLLFGMVALLFGASGTFALAQGTDDDETRAPNWAEELVYEFVASGIGTLFTAAGAAFDNSIEWFIVQYATIYTNNFGGAIELVWEVIRDMINIALIFGLIYVGFRFILNADDSGAKRNLVTLIIAALLVNFSLFFAKALVDISNILSVSFADAISSGSLGVSESFAGTLNMGPAFNADQSMTEALGGERTSYWGYILQLLIIILVAAFVFFAAAILIMIRFIVISFMLIFSPVIVLGWIFPFFSGLSRKWLNTFLGQAFMAPALLLNFYASFLVLLGLQSVSDSGLGSQATSPGSIDALPFFILGMGFLIASLIVAQKMGAAGASTAVSIGQGAARGARRRAGKFAGGAARTAGRAATAPVRYPARRGVNALGESADRRFQNLQARSDRLGQFARNNTVDRLARGATQKAAGARFGTVATNEENRDYQRNVQNRANQRAAENRRRNALEENLTTINNTSASATELNDAFANLQDTIRHMTAEEKQRLSHDQLTDSNIALNLNDRDIENLENSGRFSNEKIDEVREARDNARSAVARNGSTLDPATGHAGNTNTLRSSQRAALVNRSPQEVGQMPVDVFTDSNMTEHLTPQMVEQRMRNGNITNAQLTNMRNNILSYTTNPSTPARISKMWQNWALNNTYGAQLLS